MPVFVVGKLWYSKQAAAFIHGIVYIHINWYTHGAKISGLYREVAVACLWVVRLALLTVYLCCANNILHTFRTLQESKASLNQQLANLECKNQTLSDLSAHLERLARSFKL